jgi:antitoxin MazE
MVKKLVKHGNSLAVVLDRPVLDLLKIDETTPLEISTEDGRTLRIVPLDPASKEARVRAAFEKTKTRFSRTLKNLAK